MPGFNVLIGTAGFVAMPQEKNVDAATMQGKGYACSKAMLKHFEQDKLFLETDEYLVILDGFVLNKQQLCKAVFPMQETTWAEVVVALYKRDGERFFQAFRGSFSGVLYDKKAGLWIIFTDHIGSKFIYYTCTPEAVCCSSSMGNLYAFLHENHITPALEPENAYLLLTYGFMLEDRTICSQIKKLQPGCYLTIQDEKVTEHNYYLLSNKPVGMNRQEAIDMMDHLFREAVRIQFDKDLEYSYKHLVALSGGLDSRMTCWVAHKLGYVRQLNYTYSESDYVDESVPKQIARELRHEWVYKALDNGLWLYDIDEMTAITGGNLLYYSSAPVRYFFKTLDAGQYGMVHTGQLGDVVFGSFYLSPVPNTRFTFGQGAYATNYLHRLDGIRLKQDYANQEIANFYYRGFSGANNGLVTLNQYLETYSPFYNIDLLEKAMQIPVDLRFDHRIYKQWIIQKYPEAAAYTWEKIGTPITVPMFRIQQHDFPLSKIVEIVLRRYVYKRERTDSRKHMNPIGFYYANNEPLHRFIDNYLQEHLPEMHHPDLQHDLRAIAAGKSVTEKLQAMSLLAAVNKFRMHT